MQKAVKLIFLLASFMVFGCAHVEPAHDSAAQQQSPDNGKSESALAKSPGEFRDCPNCPAMVPVPGQNFAIGKFAVTFDEWDACVSDGGCNGYRPKDNGWGRGNRPAFNVSWNDVQTYLHWLSGKTGKDYRLPAEKEWEIATRAGSTTKYYWGDDVGKNNANCNGCGSKWVRITSPVGSFKPNAYGFYDMLGNVWQWTDGCWDGDCSRRVLRGGSWFYFPIVMEIATQNGAEVSNRNYDIGFRVALSQK